MADALCGPSNALQNFQKHTSVDRTLQQDRLSARQSPSQGFRSGPGPNAGILDPEFEAFQAGVAPALPPPDLRHFHQTPSPFSHSHPQTQPGASGWASDFQRLHISDSHSPIPPQQFRAQAPLQSGGWHREFMQQSPSVTQSRQQPAPAQMLGGGLNGYGMQGSMMYGGMGQGMESPSMAQQTQAVRSDEEIYDERAFEQAFEAARSEILNHQEEGAEQKDRQHEQGVTEAFSDPLSQDDTLNLGPQERLGADAILHEATRTEEEQRDHALEDDADELARTAGQLLNRVKDDSSRKFQDSNFLALMRRLRDREVRVEGDQIVDNLPPSDATSYDPAGLSMTGAVPNTATTANQITDEDLGSKPAHVPQPQPQPQAHQELPDYIQAATMALRQRPKGHTPHTPRDYLQQTPLERAGSALTDQYMYLTDLFLEKHQYQRAVDTGKISKEEAPDFAGWDRDMAMVLEDIKAADREVERQMRLAAGRGERFEVE